MCTIAPPKSIIRLSAGWRFAFTLLLFVSPFSNYWGILSAEATYFTEVTISNLPLPQKVPVHSSHGLSAFVEMVRIEEGTFTMGSTEGDENEAPTHTVTLSTFYMGKFEVTVGQFAAFIAETNYKTDAEKNDDKSTSGSLIYVDDINDFTRNESVNWRHDESGRVRPSTQFDYPVIHVSYNDAVAFCEWLSQKEGKKYRLPTEAEWEYAAGNGTKHTRYSWGDSAEKEISGNIADETAKQKLGVSRIFNGYTDHYVFSAPVGRFRPNSLGIHDMTGNVWEWCSDWYDSDSYRLRSKHEVNPTGMEYGIYRAIRGGSWGSSPRFARVTNRNDFIVYSYDRAPYIGFRVVHQP